jgi:Superinfection immunity protein
MDAAVSFGIIFWLFFMTIGMVMYFLPTIVAVVQHRNNIPAIALINFFLGWSFVGWIVALVMALTKDAQPVQVVHVAQQMTYPPAGYDQTPRPYGQARYSDETNIRPVNEPPGSNVQSIEQREQYPG